MKKLSILMTIVFLLGACGKPAAEDNHELFISTASSLTDAMKTMEQEFLKDSSNIKLVFNYGASGKLSTQIQQGAPVDLFLSASEHDMNILTAEGLIVEESVTPFARNRLVLASAKDVSQQEDFIQYLKTTNDTVAVGEPISVPLGEYTKEALSVQGLWDALEGQMVYAKDARQVLTYVESGNAELGIVYLSDTRVTPDVNVISELPDMQPIVYPAGIAVESTNKEAAQSFLTFLTGEEGKKILEKYGFSTIQGDTP